MPNILTQSEVELILADLGMKARQCRIGAAIAMCEAPWGPADDGEARANFSAIGDQELANEKWGYSYGGFQIRSLREQKGTGEFRDENELLRPRFNCRAARAIRNQWGGWGAWSTFNDGKYKAYLQDLFPPPPNTYVVLAGDTLSTITDEISMGWTWEDLARVNNLHSPYIIYVGQHLTLP